MLNINSKNIHYIRIYVNAHIELTNYRKQKIYDINFFTKGKKQNICRCITSVDAIKIKVDGKYNT